MTALITLSFMMRNTSPVGWVPLLLYKIFYEGCLFSYLISGFTVALPIIGLCIACDSLYFGQLTVTPINFLQANILEGFSKYFGVDPFHYYMVSTLPLFFTAMIPLLYPAFYHYYKDCKSKNIPPYFIYMFTVYLLVFSAIAHKEYRFLTPIIPVCFLVLGLYISDNLKRYRRLMTLFVLVYVIAETIVYVFFIHHHFLQKCLIV